MPQLATAFLPPLAFFSLHLANRAEVVDASQRHVARMTRLLHSCKKGQKIRRIRSHCWVFAT